MSTFDDREKGYENMFVHEQEVEFKINAKRNKLLGEWVAEKMHLAADEVENYAMGLVESAVDGIAHEIVRLKVLHDLHESGVEISEEEVEMEMARFLSIAQQDFA